MPEPSLSLGFDALLELRTDCDGIPTPSPSGLQLLQLEEGSAYLLGDAPSVRTISAGDGMEPVASCRKAQLLALNATASDAEDGAAGEDCVFAECLFNAEKLVVLGDTIRP